MSVDRFRDRVGDLYKEYFSRWDRNLELPEKGRGITRPYLKEVGLILEAYYRKENIRATLDAAREFEDRLDELNRKITECADLPEEKETYIDENRIRGVSSEVERLRAVITASKLSGRFDTKKDISITVREGFDPARRLGLKKCESYTIEELTRRMEETGAVKETRTQAVSVGEFVNTDRDIRELTGKAGEYSTAIKTLSEKYETKEKLLLDLAGIVQRRQVVINRLQNLTPLPDAVDDIDSYIELYEKEVRARDVEKNRKGKLLVDHAGLEGEAPDESVEEQERNLREAEERFETVKRTGNAVARIHDLTLSLLEGLDGDSDGFLVLDDPLVDLDPERQARAARILRVFAGDRQTLIFTCFPSHADLLGGNLIRL